MNRGIFVNRSTPTERELSDIIMGICKNDEKVIGVMREAKVIECLCHAYLDLCQQAREKTREFFGLRDFYSLIKMIYWHIKEGCQFDWTFLNKAIKRNFGGLVDVDPLEPFRKQLHKDRIVMSMENKHETNVIELIKEALVKKTTEDENRYLLLLSQNDNILDLLNNYILNELETNMHQQHQHQQASSKNSNVKVIFGSSFPNDQQYSQICRKIHQIKLSMELGKTVILLNLENLYESLYDALNQFYHKFGENEKFVDLGLGTQRVKCLVCRKINFFIYQVFKRIFYYIVFKMHQTNLSLYSKIKGA